MAFYGMDRQRISPSQSAAQPSVMPQLGYGGSYMRPPPNPYRGAYTGGMGGSFQDFMRQRIGGQAPPRYGTEVWAGGNPNFNEAENPGAFGNVLRQIAASLGDRKSTAPAGTGWQAHTPPANNAVMPQFGSQIGSQPPLGSQFGSQLGGVGGYQTSPQPSIQPQQPMQQTAPSLNNPYRPQQAYVPPQNIRSNLAGSYRSPNRSRFSGNRMY